MKKILTFLAILLPWFLSSFFINSNTSYYKNLSLPRITPPAFIFTFVWILLYITIAISIFKIYEENKCNEIKDYNKSLLINYLFNQSFALFFFTLKSPFLGFVSCMGTLISSLYLYYETKRLNPDSAKWLLPYIIWCTFATVLSLAIYLMNF